MTVYLFLRKSAVQHDNWLVVALGENWGVILNLFQDLAGYAQDFPLGTTLCYKLEFTSPNR